MSTPLKYQRTGAGTPQVINGITIAPAATRALSSMNLSSQEWRLDNLYSIVNEVGELVPFKLRPAQRKFLRAIHYRCIILKARQLGFSTFIEIFQLDCCLFVPRTKGVVIAHKKDDASTLLESKVGIPYANLHPEIQERCGLKSKNASKIEFTNGSSIEVTTSGRSGTCRLLHVSELGYIAKHRPDVAKEIVIGSFGTVHAGGFIFVESTADGAVGLFHDMVMKNLAEQRRGRRLTEKHFKVFFFPWFDEESYRMSDEDVAIVDIPRRLALYFDKLEATLGIRLDPGQRAWYSVQEDSYGEAMKQEYPSTPEEAFEASGEGKYFLRQMARVREEGRLVDELPVQGGQVVHVYMDIGVSDATAAYFVQHCGSWHHVLGYYEEVDQGMDAHIPAIKKIATENGWILSDTWYGPHDMAQRRPGKGISLAEECEKYGARFDIVPRVQDKIVSIQAARRIMGACRFDRNGPGMDKTDDFPGGISRLDEYRKKWNKVLGVWDDKPLHDANSDGADAFQCFALAVTGIDAKQRARQRAQVDPRMPAPEGGAFKTGLGAPLRRRNTLKGFTV